MTIPLFLSVGKSNYTFTRRAGSYVNGRWLDGSATTFTITCNIQPNIQGKMTKLLPEGDRSKYSIVILTNGIAQSVRTSQEGNASTLSTLESGYGFRYGLGYGAAIASELLKGDEVTWNGDVYEVREINFYNLGVLDHYMALAVRKEKA